MHMPFFISRPPCIFVRHSLSQERTPSASLSNFLPLTPSTPPQTCEEPPASIFASSRDSNVLALLLGLDGRDNSIVRRLEKTFLARVSVKMGRSKGRQAPTMPRDDSTMGQYTVGVSRSVLGCQRGPWFAVGNGKRTCEIFVSCGGVCEFCKG